MVCLVEPGCAAGGMDRLGNRAAAQRLVLALDHAAADPPLGDPDRLHRLDPRVAAVPHVAGPPGGGTAHLGQIPRRGRPEQRDGAVRVPRDQGDDAHREGARALGRLPRLPQDAGQPLAAGYPAIARRHLPVQRQCPLLELYGRHLHRRWHHGAGQETRSEYQPYQIGTRGKTERVHGGRRLTGVYETHIAERGQDDTRPDRDGAGGAQRGPVLAAAAVPHLDLGHGGLVRALDGVRGRVPGVGPDEPIGRVRAARADLGLWHLLRHRLLGPADRVRTRDPAL